jgi:cellulose synthase/poly-beta-1,6-N-acetylglucosamine synthase-like glycosyltransferase
MRVPGASTEPTVSVIIPTRDRPVLLRAAIDSALAQTRPVTQIVVVDDLQLFWFGMMTGGRGIVPHAFHVAASPGRLADELGFWSANLLSRWTRARTVEQGF